MPEGLDYITAGFSRAVMRAARAREGQTSECKTANESDTMIKLGF